MLYETVKLALGSVRRNVLRSILTLLGIVIGVAAVIAMITIGSGTTEKVKSDISKLGSNLLVVRAGRPPQPGSPPERAIRALDEKDVAALAHGLEGARAVSAASQKTVRVVYGTESLSVSVTGTDLDYFDARDWTVASGRAFTESEVRGGTGLCLLGETVRRQFFGAGDPEGMTIRVGKMSCKVIGLLGPKGFSGFGQDQDNVVLMPLTAFQRRVAGNRDIETIYVSADEATPTSMLQDRVEDILRDSRRIAPDREDDFSVRDMTQVADAMASATGVMTGMLGAVAAVSLLVGGIGIMNIMLVSVTERTREIGIRLAIGAHERHILVQFLVEATVLSLFGGLIGIALGLLIAGLASWTLTIPFSPSLAVILLAVGFSALIGMVFGFFPALRGARLDPIEALRHE
ncbi:multidrug ABC transporter substrate-binding protein [Mesorhizobium sp. L-8-10]|uniref:ABC transporter permease n=1 Tax=unclassified Mesorhizobium TaxID=325217 RepID=UPI0019292B5E|nr:MULTISPECIES: ABC transporter permease [unclassified Mesorhizobium]BCH24277.1 multidrug ABC transporter substrate-binding protein [Mesorhizobium sp. L-8-3]BCH32013.1 multidrug ABC transporter substrate-binding protein [Mesorhizobium sp. L-8-10]